MSFYVLLIICKQITIKWFARGQFKRLKHLIKVKKKSCKAQQTDRLLLVPLHDSPVINSCHAKDAIMQTINNHKKTSYVITYIDVFWLVCKFNLGSSFVGPWRRNKLCPLNGAQLAVRAHKTCINSFKWGLLRLACVFLIISLSPLQ